jgi:hypothetical protein
MINVQWIRVATKQGDNYTPSLHVVAAADGKTRCGRRGDISTIVDAQPAGKTCETCLSAVVA